jgi:predicted DNA-binding transcriptional regulator YafY
MNHKSANIRYELIIKNLNNFDVIWMKKNLLAKVNEKAKCSRTQLGDDIKYLQTRAENPAPIEIYMTGKAVCYRLTRPWSLNGLHLADDHIEKLLNLLHTTAQVEALNIIPGLKEVIAKIGAAVGEHFEEEKIKRTISFETGPKAKGYDLIPKVYDAIINKKVLSIEYQAFEAPVKQTCIVHPYLLKYYDHRYYILGENEEKVDFRQYSLDRILKIETVDKPFIPCRFEDPEEYYKNAIGINAFQDAPVMKVLLLFKKPMSYYQKTWGWHKSQKVLKDFGENGLLVSYDLILNPELIARIQSVAHLVKVIGPSPLAEKIIDDAKKVIAIYEEPLNNEVQEYCDFFFPEEELYSSHHADRNITVISRELS